MGWCIDKHDEVSQEIADRLSSELLLTDQLALHTTQDLWPGPWRWASWEVVDPVRAVELFELGVDYVVTMDCKALLADRNVVACIRNATTVRQKF